MVQFTGFCTYPHGMYTWVFLLLSCIAALTATTYAAGSCRFVRLTYSSDEGNWDEYFSDKVAAEGSPSVTYQTALGLFQWLRPTDWSEDWSQGRCVGYRTSMLSELSKNVFFEVSRGFAVFGVLLSFGVTIWTFFSACLALNWLQTVLMCLSLAAGAICTGMTFLFLRGPICNSTFGEGNSSCILDEGGLVMCAAVILWFVSMLIAAVFMRPGRVAAAMARARDGRLGGSRDPKKPRSPVDQERRECKVQELLAEAMATKYGRDQPIPYSADDSDTASSDPPGTISAPRGRSLMRWRTPERTTASNSSPLTEESTPTSGGAPTPRRTSRVTVDDVSSPNKMEVYLSAGRSDTNHLAVPNV